MENKTCLKPPSPAMVDASFLPWLSGIGSLNGVKHSRCCDGICAGVRTLRLCECYSLWSKKVWNFTWRSWRANRNAKNLNLKTQQEPGFSHFFFLKRPRCLEGSFCETGNLLILENRWVLEARKTLKIIYSTVFKKKKQLEKVSTIYMIFFGEQKNPLR